MNSETLTLAEVRKMIKNHPLKKTFDEATADHLQLIFDQSCQYTVDIVLSSPNCERFINGLLAHVQYVFLLEIERKLSAEEN